MAGTFTESLRRSMSSNGVYDCSNRQVCRHDEMQAGWQVQQLVKVKNADSAE